MTQHIQDPSPWDAERVRPLTRCQIADRTRELGDLYAANSGAEPMNWDIVSRAFLIRLATDMRRPGFALLVAETGAGERSATACAYGFPLHDGLFAIREIVVRARVRRESPGRDWNLARRLQRRLLGDHGDATGLTLVERSDLWTLDALRSWGWREVRGGSDDEVPACPPCRVLLLDP
ncbi:hypothetical protein AB0J38_06280 [Streptomyces sp. NPDC050095]|uniref:hypothetical protein n=1 Tax=unclassified Streptomyces TaxID=2593676 RepID=UPI0034376FEA